MLHLFKTGARGHELGVRELEKGRIIVGRDESADWTIPDPDQEISRRHLELTHAGERLCLRAIGVNGVKLNRRRTPIQTGEMEVIGDEDEFQFGKYTVVVQYRGTVLPPVKLPVVPKRGTAGADRAFADNLLLDAFCEGAGLDASAFAADEPADMLRRAGKIYRHTVYQLCDQAIERHQAKEIFALDRTTISAGENNPLRWSAPHRVLADLIRQPQAGFLDGADAVHLSLVELRRHLVASKAGYEAVLMSIANRFDPSLLVSSPEKPWLATARKQKWSAFELAYEALKSDIAGQTDALRRAFAAGYEQSLLEQEQTGTQ